MSGYNDGKLAKIFQIFPIPLYVTQHEKVPGSHYPKPCDNQSRDKALLY